MTFVLRDYWRYTTMLIENEWGKFGTGFIVGNHLKTKIYLVTNKHVLSRDPAERQNAKRLIIHLNKKDGNSIVGSKLEISLDNIRYQENPNQDIDIMVFDITMELLPLMREDSLKA